MNQSAQVVFRKFDGPSLFAPFAAVIVDFTARSDEALPAMEIERHFANLLPPDLRPALALPEGEITRPELAGRIANAWQDLTGENELPM